jgi:hypothetical protein
LKPLTNCFQKQTSSVFGFTLFALIPCGYVGWQAKIVRERQALRKWIEEHGGSCYSDLPRHPKGEIPSVVRRWLGDERVSMIGFNGEISDADAKRIEQIFPGVKIVTNLSAIEAADGSPPATKP